MLFIEKSRKREYRYPRDGMEQNKQYKSAFRSTDSPVAPLGHLVVDRHLKETVRLHVGSYFLQSLKGKHTKSYKDSNPGQKTHFKTVAFACCLTPPPCPSSPPLLIDSAFKV